MASDIAAAPAPLLRIAQVALLVRLALLLFVELVWVVEGGPGEGAPAVVVVVVLSYASLASPRLRRVLTRHPLVVLVDVVLVAGVVGIVGVDTPFVLALGTSALLVGLWLSAVPGALVMSILVAIHLTLLSRLSVTGEAITAFGIVVPALFVTLWLLGLAVQRSTRAEAVAQASLGHAMAAAATSQERTRIAREMHDTVAKSLQAMALTAASIPIHLERRPERAAVHARELEAGCRDAVTQVRSLICELRVPAPTVPFAMEVGNAVEEWRSSTGRRCVTSLDPVEVADSHVRYELLMGMCEALENIHRHAGRCTAQVRLTEVDDRVVLTVSDDGVGSDRDHVEASAQRGHFGVFGLRERMAQVGGRMSLETAPGKGTTVAFSVHGSGLVERHAEKAS